MNTQDKLYEEKDEFVELLHLTPEKIREDMQKMKDIDGFPIGDDEDILNLSNPPYYTAYPNPYIKDFIEKYGTPYDEETDDYHREPYVGDISEGKNELVYSIHNYHTKVPPKAIEKYIKHYSNENDIILDFFCGSGMIGIAANRLRRNSILLDLSPAATYISSTINIKHASKFELFEHLDKIIKDVKNELQWVYETVDSYGKKQFSSYYVNSDIFYCPFCKYEFPFWDYGVEQLEGKVKTKKKFYCPKCNSELNVRKVVRVIDNEKDIKKRKCVKVYSYDSKERKKILRDLNEHDWNIIKRISELNIPYWYPTTEINPEWYTSKLSQSGDKKITDVSRFFSKRNLLVISAFWDKCENIENPKYRNTVKFLLTSLFAVISDRQGFFGGGGGMPGNFYMPIISMEKNIFECLERKMKKFGKFIDAEKNNKSNTIISCQSSTNLNNIPKNSIDYIFVDPPFGANLMYSELNAMFEGWLRVLTNNTKEAIINDFQNKNDSEYFDLMTQCFNHAFRILKPNRWISVEFHNTKASIWRMIQNSLVKAGFIIAQVATLDKQTSTLLQNIRDGAVNNDLLINAYKPSKKFRNTFLHKVGFNMENEFIDMHLDKLPIEPNIERTQQMLYSKLLAQYIQNGFEVRMDASEFYLMLEKYFVERDGYWFNECQIETYEKRLKLSDNLGKLNINQSVLGVSDEKTAIIWLTQYLRKPRTYDEIYIDFSKNLLTSEDKIPELKTILDENFVTENGKYKLPNIAEKKKKEEIRAKKLQRDFEYIFTQASQGKKITEVRREALIYGLMKLYQNRNVDHIRLIGKKLDHRIIESDDDIYSIVDWAMTKDN